MRTAMPISIAPSGVTDATQAVGQRSFGKPAGYKANCRRDGEPERAAEPVCRIAIRQAAAADRNVHAASIAERKKLHRCLPARQPVHRPKLVDESQRIVKSIDSVSDS